MDSRFLGSPFFLCMEPEIVPWYARYWFGVSLHGLGIHVDFWTVVDLSSMNNNSLLNE